MTDDTQSGAISEPEIKHFLDLGFTVVATSYEHYVEYVIYEIISAESGDPDAKVTWQLKDAHSYPHETDSLDAAQIYISGSVKWDGCSNWSFLEQEETNSLYHFCDQESLLNLGKILAACWEWTATLCPNWDGQ